LLGFGALTFAVITGEIYGYEARGVVALFVVGLCAPDGVRAH
jgi:hypothetical protein